ncbi:DUF4845 domain-containing protein [Nitrosococcus oceani]|uniref:Transmembrane protein n=2 Tax=Nitrosococcus oceani TaxID=1229 RepID=Q3J8D4_NITOC|nr:DUF4845 domain-containing protein [Nitrosococcus oceani]KFI18712.1 hypothetical protein IB75_13085 [Nitrosococcus oceani C-27]ABA58912.1 conserved hypothetical protein [Nitrosococcus oceani ATCC 19707]EDZ67134.1 hypothetical protein NOC27_461 [Nitrosococcus oceani AFC27]KFI21830.1 hypothetical protein HW44_12605 [Nitrosococcus oceani]GEM18992.1 DUF4845 domain-containing protein [Nitrosococcus oceani]
MHYRKQQGGMSFLGWILVLALLALVGLGIMRLFPLYMEYFSVKTSLESLVNQPDLHAMGKTNIRNALLRRLDINDVAHVSKENIEIIKTRRTVTVAVDYEVRTPFLGNIDLMAHFNPLIEVSSP